MDLQTWTVLIIVAAAGYYVVRNFIPRKDEPKGCASCPQNSQRNDDYT
jgi:hypothetical protein